MVVRHNLYNNVVFVLPVSRKRAVSF